MQLTGLTSSLASCPKTTMETPMQLCHNGITVLHHAGQSVQVKVLLLLAGLAIKSTIHSRLWRAAATSSFPMGANDLHGTQCRRSNRIKAANCPQSPCLARAKFQHCLDLQSACSRCARASQRNSGGQKLRWYEQGKLRERFGKIKRPQHRYGLRSHTSL